MFARTLCCLVMAAVFACPIWCRQGLCPDDCCTVVAGVDVSPQQHSSLQQHSRCCDHCAMSDRQRPADPPPSSPGPDSAGCQGICGGVVFEPPCCVVGMETVGALILPALHNETPLCRDSLVDSGDGPPGLLSSGDNPGRSLRALHMSFLC